MNLDRESLGMWYKEFPDLWDSDGLSKIMEHVNDKHVGDMVVPAMHEVFKPFYMTEPETVKLIILCNEPYTTTFKGIPFANGLALDCHNMTYWNSTKQTPQYDWLMAQYQAYEPESFNVHLLEGNLRIWAEHGVLLLNVALTGEIGKQEAHLNIWSGFTLGLLSRMKKRGLAPPVMAFAPYSYDIAKSEGFDVYQVKSDNDENFFEAAERLMGHSIVW